MANTLILLDARLFVAGGDFSGSGNRIEIAEEAETKPTTNWRSGGAQELLAGIRGCDLTGEGQWEAGDASKVDDVLWAGRRRHEPWTASQSGDSDLSAGSTMWMTKALRTKSTIWGQLGEVAGWNAIARGTWPLVRGVCAHPSGVPRTANGFGPAYELGAVAADQYFYANLHVLSISGTSTPTLTVEFETDVDDEFNSPTSRGSFAAKTIVDGESIRIPGPITDTWWQPKWTITGTDPSFLFLAAMGIE